MFRLASRMNEHRSNIVADCWPVFLVVGLVADYKLSANEFLAALVLFAVFLGGILLSVWREERAKGQMHDGWLMRQMLWILVFYFSFYAVTKLLF